MYNKKNDFINYLFVRLSALQKSIRRGNVSDSLFFANLLFESSSGGPKLIVNKLLTYLTEDIGFSNISLSFNLYNLLISNKFTELDKNNLSFPLKELTENLKSIDKDKFLKIIYFFAATSKNREIDNCIVSNRLGENQEDDLFFQEFSQEFMFLNESLFSKELKGGNFMFISYLETNLDDEGKKLLNQDKYHLKDIKLLYKKYNDLIKEKLIKFTNGYENKTEVDKLILNNYLQLTFYFKELLNGKDGVLLYYTFFYLWGKYNLSLSNLIIDSLNSMVKENELFLESINLNNIDYKTNRPIPDYAYDKHTSQGKKMKRGKIHFLEEGAKVNNKVIIFDDFYQNKINNYIKKNKEGDGANFFNI